MSVQAAENVSGKRLSGLLSGLYDIDQAQDMIIDDLCLDSRKAREGSLFFAVPGGSQDRRENTSEAIQAGASAVLFESDGWTFDGANPQRTFGISNLRRHIGPVADVFYDRPSSKNHVVGITGTNGKSTCAILTAQSLQRLGRSCGVIGTLGSGLPGHFRQSSLTTPDPISLQRELALLVRQGVKYVCLEVSSHSLDQSRNEGVRFGTVVFTNLSRDHLDYHRTEEHYRTSKSKLFTKSAASSAVLNIDDAFGRSLISMSNAERIVTYGTGEADVRLLDCVADIDGVSISIGVETQTIQVRSALLGRFNATNILTVAAVLHALDFDVADIEHGLADLEPVAGRMERIPSAPEQPAVFVDYAHTPDGLENAMTSLRELISGRLWCVFGCGGNRDDEKRPLMGAIAERVADEIIITDDNPRDEDPKFIARRIMDGMRSNPTVIHERDDAIRYAIGQAARQDAVLVAGKGHESTQTYRDKVRPFSDRSIITEVLRGEA